MPNLSNKDVHEFWHNHHDPMVYKAIAFLESVDNWTVDNDQELEKAITHLGTELDNIGYIDLQEEETLIKILVYLKTGRMLRLLQCLDAAHPGAAAKLLTIAKEKSKTPNDTPGIFLRRNVVFERLRILSRVFATDRLTAITKILTEEKHA